MTRVVMLMISIAIWPGNLRAEPDITPYITNAVLSPILGPADGVAIAALAVNLRSVARAQRGGSGWIWTGGIIGAVNLIAGAVLTVEEKTGGWSAAGPGILGFGALNIAAAIGARLQPTVAAPPLAARRIRHALRLQGEWGTIAAHDCSHSPWGGLSVHYGFLPHQRIQIDAGIGLRGISSRCTQTWRPDCPAASSAPWDRPVPPVAEVDFEVTPRFVLSAGALRWLPGAGVIGGPSLTSAGQRGSVVVRVEPLAFEIAFARATSLFFAAGLAVGLAGTYCQPCSGVPTCVESTVAGAIGAYQRMGVTFRM